MKTMRISLLVLSASLLLAACSGHQVYDSAQGLRQSECNKQVDAQKQQQCLDEANKSYETYDKERKGASKY